MKANYDSSTAVVSSIAVLALFIHLATTMRAPGEEQIPRLFRDKRVVTYEGTRWSAEHRGLPESSSRHIYACILRTDEDQPNVVTATQVGVDVIIEHQDGLEPFGPEQSHVIGNVAIGRARPDFGSPGRGGLLEAINDDGVVTLAGMPGLGYPSHDREGQMRIFPAGQSPYPRDAPTEVSYGRGLGRLQGSVRIEEVEPAVLTIDGVEYRCRLHVWTLSLVVNEDLAPVVTRRRSVYFSEEAGVLLVRAERFDLEGEPLSVEETRVISIQWLDGPPAFEAMEDIDGLGGGWKKPILPEPGTILQLLQEEETD